MEYKATTSKNISEREKRNYQRSMRIAADGMVLLKNDGTLPFSTVDKVALFGSGARRTVTGGTGSGDVNVRASVSIEEGLEKAGFQITTKAWLDRYDQAVEAAKSSYANEIKKEISEGNPHAKMKLFTQPFRAPESIPVTDDDIRLSETDTAIYVISRISGEGKDRSAGEGDFALSTLEREILDRLSKEYQSLVVLLNVGGVIDTTQLRENEGVNALLLVSQAGIGGGDAVAKLLTGEIGPSGHLSATWAKRYQDYPCADTYSYLNGDLDEEYYNEGIYVGYRYFDTFNVKPAYPFGYGLSYTSFSIETGEITSDGTQITVNGSVKNKGNSKGREVVQVYVSSPSKRLERPYQELAGFWKSHTLHVGETEDFSISFNLFDLSGFDIDSKRHILEKGDYILRIGEHSRDTKVAAVLELEQEVLGKELAPLFKDDVKLNELSFDGKTYSYEGEESEIKNAKRISVASLGELTGEQINSGIPESDFIEDAETTSLINKLTKEELAQLCVGTSRMDSGDFSFIGQSSYSCPGAAGDTTSVLKDSYGVRNLVMADGPAGLRISRFFAVDENGEHIPDIGDYPMPGMEILNGPPKQDAPEGAVMHYQFCTALPIDTLLAQTWDLDAIRDVGDIVGEEMEEFGVNLWLAPGMNIQRNPLCGRNFEYYSEDPLLTGLCAVAETDGVQSHAGAGTVIKHFALNNQEDNRMHVNEHVSERAAREIYLRGFEIAVRRSQPFAVMSSYNLICGIHAANRYDLLEQVLRGEWGFKGLVMTDWGTTGGIEMEQKEFKYGTSNVALCIYAGNDLIMPGSNADVKGILDGLDSGVITEDMLRRCASRIIHVIRRVEGMA